jgi:diaminopimelate decarboxylase
MIKGNFPVAKFGNVETPFYYYDVELLNKTLDFVIAESGKCGCEVHYAIKANANVKILKLIVNKGFGADCVSGGEVKLALEAGFPASKIVFAGVGKTDREIELALEHDIFCFNVESVPELEVINALAAARNKTANVALRINPNVDAHTHHHITTGLNENKFGFSVDNLDDVLSLLPLLKNIKLIGLHFHIGSQITDFSVFESLCTRINEVQDLFDQKGIKLENINVGGGLGIDYKHPNQAMIADFESYFRLFGECLQLRPQQRLHCEPGRPIIAPCGSLITKVTYVKKGIEKQFAIVDAGMTDLIRPALYDAYHCIENITSGKPVQRYDVVGPVCESADVFSKNVELNETQRGDLLAIRSAGAYGEAMASQYNLRKLPDSHLSSEF